MYSAKIRSHEFMSAGRGAKGVIFKLYSVLRYVSFCGVSLYLVYRFSFSLYIYKLQQSLFAIIHKRLQTLVK